MSSKTYESNLNGKIWVLSLALICGYASPLANDTFPSQAAQGIEAKVTGDSVSKLEAKLPDLVRDAYAANPKPVQEIYSRH